MWKKYVCSTGKKADLRAILWKDSGAGNKMKITWNSISEKEKIMLFLRKQTLFLLDTFKNSLSKSTHNNCTYLWDTMW